MRILGTAVATATLGLALALMPMVSKAKEISIAMGASGDGALQKAQRLFAQKIEEKTGGAYTGRTFEGTLLNYT